MLMVIAEKRTSAQIVLSDSESDVGISGQDNTESGTGGKAKKRPAKKQKRQSKCAVVDSMMDFTLTLSIATVGTINVDEVDDEGMLADVKVQDIEKPKARAARSDKVRDINHFFGQVFQTTGKNGEVGPHRNCKQCK